jgi:hypothetical protein
VFATRKELRIASGVVSPKANGGDHGQRYIALAYRRSNTDYHFAVSVLALKNNRWQKRRIGAPMLLKPAKSGSVV